MRLAPFAMFAMFATGCALEPANIDTEQPIGGDEDDCPVWMCGMNSPVIDHRGLHEFNLDHLPNKEGFRFERAVRGFLPYTLHVTNGRVTATGVFGTISGGALVGLQLYFRHDSGAVYVVRISDVLPTQYWAAVASVTTPSIETYTLEWGPTRGGAPTGRWENLCPTTPSKIDSLTIDEFHSVLFEGERIHSDTKDIEPDTDSRWVNIGCAGSTLAKLYLTGHVKAAAVDGFVTTIPQRQTMLKMLSSDICGHGKPFTVAGMRLDWTDDLRWMKIPNPANDVLEARWTPGGATCLNKPRVLANPTKLSDDTFTDVEADIALECGERPPYCDDNSLDPGDDHLISANPNQ